MIMYAWGSQAYSMYHIVNFMSIVKWKVDGNFVKFPENSGGADGTKTVCPAKIRSLLLNKSAHMVYGTIRKSICLCLRHFPAADLHDLVKQKLAAFLQRQFPVDDPA